MSSSESDEETDDTIAGKNRRQYGGGGGSGSGDASVGDDEYEGRSPNGEQVELDRFISDDEEEGHADELPSNFESLPASVQESMEGVDFDDELTEEEREVIIEHINLMSQNAKNPEVVAQAMDDVVEIGKGFDKPWRDGDSSGQQPRGRYSPLHNAGKEHYGVAPDEDKAIIQFSEEVLEEEIDGGPKEETITHEVMHGIHKSLGYDIQGRAARHSKTSEKGVFSEYYDVPDFMLSNNKEFYGLEKTEPVESLEDIREGELVVTSDGTVGTADIRLDLDSDDRDQYVQVDREEYDPSELERSALSNESFVEDITELDGEAVRVADGRGEQFGIAEWNEEEEEMVLRHPNSDHEETFNEAGFNVGSRSAYRREDGDIKDSMNGQTYENTPGWEAAEQFPLDMKKDAEEQDWNDFDGNYGSLNEGDYVLIDGVGAGDSNTSGKVIDVDPDEGSVTVEESFITTTVESDSSIKSVEGHIEATTPEVEADSPEERFIGQANVAWYRMVAEQEVIGSDAVDYVHRSYAAYGANETTTVMHGNSQVDTDESTPQAVKQNFPHLHDAYTGLFDMPEEQN